MNNNTRFFRHLALLGYFGLLVWVPVWNFWLSPTSLSTGFVLAIFILPLLFPLKGLLKADPYTHAWTNFIVMIYFMHGLASTVTDPDEIWYAIIELLFATALFIGCSYFARLRGRELGLKLKKLSEISADEKAQFDKHNS